MNDIEKALRCLSSQTAEGDCYCDYYNFMNPDKPKMVCQKETYGSELVCPYFQNEYSVCFEDGECGEWLETAANLIAELQQYRQIGTLEECREAREKQEARKPIKDKESCIRYTAAYICPRCGKGFAGTGIADYCYHCGQKLDWEAAEEPYQPEEDKKSDVVVPSLKMVDFSELKVPGIVIYDHPLDYPDSYIARVWEMSIDKPTNICIKNPDLKSIREDIMLCGKFLIRVERLETDDNCIVETWI